MLWSSGPDDGSSPAHQPGSAADGDGRGRLPRRQDRAAGCRATLPAPTKDSYPIAGFTYLLVYRDLGDMEPRKARALVRFLWWILTEGQPEATKLHYTPLPADLRDAALHDINRIVLPAAALEGPEAVVSPSHARRSE